MRRLVVNADDFGLCHGVNLGILHGYQEGIVTSATLMVNMPGTAEAFALARAHPRLGVGVHVNLTAGRPIASGVDSLTSPDGRFLKLPQLMERAQPEHIHREVAAQVRSFLSAGLQPTHLDSHHHVHDHMPVVASAMAEAASQLGIPVRSFGPELILDFYGRDAVSLEALAGILRRLPDGLSELMCHPAYVDPLLLRLSSYTLERVMELSTLTAPAALEMVQSSGVVLVDYRGEQRTVHHG